MITNNSSVGWSSAEDMLLRELWTQGLTCMLISIKMGRSRSACSARARRLKLPERKKGVKPGPRRRYT